MRDFYNRPLNTGSTINSELANQPTRRALFTCMVYPKNRREVGRWSRVMEHEEKVQADERSLSPAITQGYSYLYLLKS